MTSIRRSALALAIMSCCVLAHAEDAEPITFHENASERIEKARAAADDLSYDVALDLVRPIITHPTARIRMQALEITATTLLVIGKPEDARVPLKNLYDLSPGFVVTDQSLPPRVTAAFEAEAAREHARATSLRLVPDGGSPTAFVAQATGPANKVEIACRSGGGSWQPIATHGALGRYDFNVPTRGDNLCYVIALDADDIALGRLGTIRQPIHLASHESRPITTRWWFWTGAAAIVAAGTVTAIILTRPSQSHPPQADGTIMATNGQFRF
jgi:hypothetical protein